MSDESNPTSETNDASDEHALTVIDNTAEQQYEVHIGDEVAVLTYERRRKRITFFHTGVPPALEGHGIAGLLARTALEAARANGLEVVPLCPYVAAYIRRHQEYLPLVSKAFHAQILEGE
jgi:predicted GNAT family acetyltransferase